MEFNAIWDDPLLVCTLPEEINLEIKEWVDESIKIKNHPLSEYKAHNNVGYLDTIINTKNLDDIREGTVMIFPSHHLHYVNPVAQPRCTISFNITSDF